MESRLLRSYHSMHSMKERGLSTDVKRMQADYEARLAEKEKAIQERDRALESKESRIAQLEQKLLYLERKMWGAMSEKRRIPDDPNQLKLDFDSAAWKSTSILTAIWGMKTNGSCSRMPKRPNTWNSSLPNCTSG